MILLTSGVLLGIYLVGMLIWALMTTPVSPRNEAVLPEAPVTGDIQPREPHQFEIPRVNPAQPVPAVE